MKYLSPVVWAEGMYLGPHHFQAQSRYFEDSILFATSSLWHCNYGLSVYAMDPEALTNGTVSVLHARGIFPDGLQFHMPESDPLPEPRGQVLSDGARGGVAKTGPYGRAARVRGTRPPRRPAAGAGPLAAPSGQ